MPLINVSPPSKNLMLCNWRDWQSIAYLMALPLLVCALWQVELNVTNYLHHPIYLLGYSLLILLTIGVGAIHHHHAHLRMWENKTLNRYTDFWLCLLQGHPTFVFYASHNANHHRYHHGVNDITRTYRFGGDTNHLLAYVLHPFQALLVLYPLFITWLQRLYRRVPRVFWYCMRQYALIVIAWLFLATIHWQKFLFLVLLPQLFGLHWLLATNYLQHAHADGNSRLNFARNFSGGVNIFYFNIGFHTAHHLHPRVHWSCLPRLHQQIQSTIDPRLNAGSLITYMLRTFVGSLVWSPWRSQSLMQNKLDSLPVIKEK
jgi:fatty acid desaturase